MKVTNKEINGLKTEVKKLTGKNDVAIESYSDNFITFSFFKTNYDKVLGNKTCETIKR